MFVREKQLTRDEKLLNTFRKINELNMSKMAEAHPEFIFRPANNHNTSHDSKTRDRSTSPSSVLKSADVTLRYKRLFFTHVYILFRLVIN